MKLEVKCENEEQLLKKILIGDTRKIVETYYVEQQTTSNIANRDREEEK